MTKSNKIGWAIALAAVGVLFTSGFQNQSVKMGSVDLSKVYADSDFASTRGDALRAKSDVRTGILQFMQTYPVFTADQVLRFRELSLKDSPTAAEKAELEKLKKDVMDTQQKYVTLQQKPNPTSDEIALLQEYNNRTQAIGASIQRWAQEFDDELKNLNDQLHNEAMDRVTKAVKSVSAKRGLTVVFTNDAVPYGANDITAEALKAMNQEK